MARNLVRQRRRAAVAVLSGVLDDRSLLQELWVRHDTMGGESVTEIIEYVDALARRHMLDAATCKRLYGEFFKAMRQPEDSLPLDPWPAMQALRASVAAPMARNTPDAKPVGQPLGPASAASAAPSPLAEEPSAVFAVILKTVVAEISRCHRHALEEIRSDAMHVLAGSAAPADLRNQFSNAWQRAQQHDWNMRGQPGDLTELLRVVHKALELAFGRDGADQILQRGMEAAELLPEARRFSPRRLLSAV